MTKFHGVEMTVAHQFSTGGWTCAFCGCYVFYGSEHWCYRSPSNLPQPAYLPQWQPTQIIYPDPAITELQDLLRQLIEKVDQLIEKIEQ